MPLIACPDCRGPVSPSARACPACGSPVRKKRPPGFWHSVLVVTGSPVTAVALALWYFLDVSGWIVGPVWALIMGYSQYVFHAQRRAWKQPWKPGVEERSEA